jgi:hypothetical protein
VRYNPKAVMASSSSASLEAFLALAGYLVVMGRPVSSMAGVECSGRR